MISPIVYCNNYVMTVFKFSSSQDIMLCYYYLFYTQFVVVCQWKCIIHVLFCVYSICLENCRNKVILKQKQIQIILSLIKKIMIC